MHAGVGFGHQGTLPELSTQEPRFPLAGRGSSPSSISASLPITASLPMAQTALPAMDAAVGAATAAPIALAVPMTGGGGGGPLGTSGASFAMSSKMAGPMPAGGGGMATGGGIGFRTGECAALHDERLRFILACSPMSPCSTGCHTGQQRQLGC